MNLASLFQRVVNRARVEIDLVRWRRDLTALRAVPANGKRTVLFCELLTMRATAKVEALMAAVLRLKEYRMVVLLERPDHAIERIFKAADDDAAFVYLSDAIGAVEQDAAARQADEIMRQASSLQDIVGLTRDGFRIGRNVQSLVLRRFRVGRLDDGNPEHHAATRAVLTRSLAVKAFAEEFMRTRRLDLAIFLERGYTPAGEIFDACIGAGVDVIQWTGAPQSDCLIYRRYDAVTRNEHPLALSDAMWERLKAVEWGEAEERAVVDRIAANYDSGAWYNRQQLQDGKAIQATDTVRAKLGLDPMKKTAVIFSHILYDATFFYGDSLFEDYEHWLVETVRCAIANPALNWVVKVHPVNIWRSKMDGTPLVQLEAQSLARAFGPLPDHVKMMPADTDINTYSLFAVADYGLTVRGTIGMELPCFGIPVVTAGTGRYSGRGFTIDPDSQASYRQVLASLQDVPPLNAEEIRLARKHYFGALNLRPVPMQSFSLNYPDGAPPSTALKRRADRGLLETPDLGRFAKWAASSRAPELLAHDF